MKNIKEFIVLSESVRFTKLGVTLFRGDVVGKDHPCFDYILPYPNCYANKLNFKNQFKVVEDPTVKSNVSKAEEALEDNIEVLEETSDVEVKPEVKIVKVEENSQPVKKKSSKKKQG